MRVYLTSMMAFNSWLYGIFAVVAGTSYWLVRRPAGAETDRARSWLVPLLGFGIVLGIVFPSQSGVFFGVVEAKPYWNNPLLPILFLVGAIASGAAVLLLIMTLICTNIHKHFT